MTHKTIPGVNARRRWRDFWARQTTPLHTGETEDDYRALAGDFSHSMLTEFRARCPGIELVEADATDFTLPETFDRTPTSPTGPRTDHNR